MTDTFKDSVEQATGTYAGDYLWSLAGNWSAGLPVSSSVVTLNLAAATSVVDTTMSVASITYGSGGTLLVGATLTAGAVSGTALGSTLSVASSGSLSVTGTLTLTGGTLDVAGTAAIASLGLKTMTVEGNATVGQIGGGGITVSNHGTLEVTTGTSAALSAGGDAFTLDGGTLKLDSSVVLLSGSSFKFGATAVFGASSVYVGDAANFTSLSNAFSNFDVGDSLQLGNATFTSATYSAVGHTLTLDGATDYTLVNFQLATDVGATTFGLSKAANGGSIITLNCFLAGTRIETPTGAVAIETLSVGDLVLTVRQGERIARPIRWIGGRDVDRASMDRDAAREAAPVRIRADAFANGIPARDLLVTPDHCIFESGVLIPARMLVNGASIVHDSDDAAYHVHHIAFATHAIVLSEGLTTESFLDTEGGAGFANGPAGGSLSWARDAAAPLTTSRDAVEPVWRRLADRAESIGLGAPRAGAGAETTSDPDLRVRLADGTLLRPRRQRGLRHFFVLPPGADGAILHSRAAMPAEIEGPFVDDRRQLGVCVRAATLWTELRSTTLPLRVAGQPGWHAPEPGAGACWTNGAGGLELPALTRQTIPGSRARGDPPLPGRPRGRIAVAGLGYHALK